MPIPVFRDDGWLPPGHHEATWAEIIQRFDNPTMSRRSFLSAKLLELRDALRSRGVAGILLLDGSHISAKPEPGDFDILLVGPTDIQTMKEHDPLLAEILDAESVEQRFNCSLFHLPINSPALGILSTLWDFTKNGIPKGVVKVAL